MNIYWKDVREQKATLQELIAGVPVGSRTSEHLKGVLHLIDGVQDKAIEDGWSEKDVLGYTEFVVEIKASIRREVRVFAADAENAKEKAVAGAKFDARDFRESADYDEIAISARELA